MPQMGYDMEKGTIVRWIKAEGDEVKRGDPIAEIETDKAVVEMESTAGGVLRKILVGVGASAPVGQPIAIIAAADEDISSMGVGAAPVVKEAPSGQLAVEARLLEQDAKASPERIKASPVARKLAEERGIDLAQINGTGPGGRITREDVLAFKAPAPAAPRVAPPVAAPAAPRLATPPAPAARPPVAGPSVPAGQPGHVALSRMRQGIARATSQSKHGTPHFYLTSEMDMTSAMATRSHLNDHLEGVRVSVNDLVMKAVVMALKKFPNLNASYKEDHLVTYPYINLGMAIAVEQGLMVPAIVNAQDKTLVQLAVASKDLAERTQQGRLRQEEYSGTFSTTNLGMYGIDEFSAVILPPQAAVLAIGAVKKRPVVVDDQVVVRQMMNVTISVDHRVSDGVEAASYLQELKRILERPAILLV